MPNQSCSRHAIIPHEDIQWARRTVPQEVLGEELWAMNKGRWWVVGVLLIIRRGRVQALSCKFSVSKQCSWFADKTMQAITGPKKQVRALRFDRRDSKPWRLGLCLVQHSYSNFPEELFASYSHRHLMRHCLIQRYSNILWTKNSFTPARAWRVMRYKFYRSI